MKEESTEMIKLKGVRKHYGDFEALRGISFAVNSGEIMGLLGPNGAGKTTMMRIICCYLYPNSGEVTVNRQNVFTDAMDIKHDIGYLPENAPLYTELKTGEYLQFMADARGIARSEQRQRLEWVIERCGLGPMVYRTIDTLSKGYRQRVGLAQAIIHDPPILIMDEPTTGLDPNQIIEIRQLIASLGKKKTVILSTHILQEVEAICDSVLILHEGAIAAIGTTTEIASEMKGAEHYSVIFKAASTKVDLQRLIATMPAIEQLGAVSRASALPGECWQADFTLKKDDNNLGSEQIFDWAVAQRLKILELTRKRASLEEIFTRLTTAERGAL